MKWFINVNQIKLTDAFVEFNDVLTNFLPAENKVLKSPTILMTWSISLWSYISFDSYIFSGSIVRCIYIKECCLLGE